MRVALSGLFASWYCSFLTPVLFPLVRPWLYYSEYYREELVTINSKGTRTEMNEYHIFSILDIHHHEDSVEAFTMSSLLCPPSPQQIAVTHCQMETSRSNPDLQSYQHGPLSLQDCLIHPQ